MRWCWCPPPLYFLLLSTFTPKSVSSRLCPRKNYSVSNLTVTQLSGVDVHCDHQVSSDSISSCSTTSWSGNGSKIYAFCDTGFYLQNIQQRRSHDNTFFRYKITCCSSRTLRLYCTTPSCGFGGHADICDGHSPVASVSSVKKYFGGVAADLCPQQNGLRKWKAILCDCGGGGKIATMTTVKTRTRQNHRQPVDRPLWTPPGRRHPVTKVPRGRFQPPIPPQIPSRTAQNHGDSETHSAWGWEGGSG